MLSELTRWSASFHPSGHWTIEEEKLGPNKSPTTRQPGLTNFLLNEHLGTNLQKVANKHLSILGFKILL